MPSAVPKPMPSGKIAPKVVPDESAQGFRNFGDTPEAVALSLLAKAAQLERINLTGLDVPGKKMGTTKWLLTKYATILKTVKP